MMLTDKNGEPVEVTQEADRFSIAVDGKPVGLTAFVEHGEQRIFYHTEIDPAFGGRGLASVLIAQALATTRQLVSEPQLVGGRLHVREELGSRVVPDQPGRRGFFYREWTIWSGPWKALQDPKVHCVDTEVIYSAATAWRPWMKMGDGPGHTVQNGRGGKVERVEDLPPELLRLTRQVHPDLVRDPAGVLAAERR